MAVSSPVLTEQKSFVRFYHFLGGWIFMDFSIVTSEGISPSPLSITLSGSRLELLGFMHGKKVAIEEEFGKITIRLLDEKPVVTVVEPSDVSSLEEEVLEEAVEEVPVVQEEVPVTKKPLVELLEQDSTVPREVQLLQALVGLRRQLAFDLKVPAYVIFHDKTLQEICKVKPTDMEQLRGVVGVGVSKAEKYGEKFLEVIREHLGE
jgi:ATP-dependent DNA helicase RecQ